MQEELKEIPGYPSYFVTKTGKVYTNKRNKLKELAYYRKKGYLFVKMNNEFGIRKFIGVHRAVALTYIPTSDSSQEINHKNFIRDDNRLENLEWVSHFENVRLSRHRAIKTTSDAGEVKIYSHVSDCARALGREPNNIHKYARGYCNHYCKLLGLTFELLDTVIE